jgi:hypothetical protein
VLALMLLRPDHGSGNRPAKGSARRAYVAVDACAVCATSHLSLRISASNPTACGLCWSHGRERAGRQTLMAHLGWPPGSDTSPRTSSAPAQPMARPKHAPNTQRCDHRRNWGYFRAIPPEREASFSDPGPYRIDSRRIRHTSPTRGPCTGAPEAAGLRGSAMGTGTAKAGCAGNPPAGKATMGHQRNRAPWQARWRPPWVSYRQAPVRS